MAVLTDKITDINSVLKELFEFLQTNDTVKTDFEEYLTTIGTQQISLNQMEKIFLPYIFERKIGEKFSSIIDLFIENSQTKYLQIAKSLSNAQNSVFEIKKILKNGFELYNLVNEKEVSVLSLTKMTNFRGVYAGQYIVARIFECEGEHYIIEISNVLSHSQKSDAMRYAVMQLVQSPQLLYRDNAEKEKQITTTISEMYKKFIQTFDTDIILTTNQYADDIIGSFNEGESIDLTDKISNLDKYRFFHVKELDNNYSNFLENSLGGFSSHNEIYDVAVIFDKDNGLYAIPFYETFMKIFQNEDIEGAKECIEYFMHNDAIPDTILKRVAKECPNFIDKINEIFESNYTLEELISEYKSEYLSNKIYSSATVLYCSNAFSQMFDIISQPQETNTQPVQKVGRNEPCPCGSGKKYKNCCGKS